jgi:hypothetical protein
MAPGTTAARHQNIFAAPLDSAPRVAYIYVIASAQGRSENGRKATIMGSTYYVIQLRDPKAGPAYQLSLYCAAGTTEADAQRVVRVARRHGQGARLVTRNIAPEQGGSSVSSLLGIVRS